MKHFARMTKKVNDATKKNVVIMGKNTWNEIKRPLPDRINVVLTKTLSQSDVPESVILCGSLSKALDKIKEPELVEKIENVWIIGERWETKIFMLKFNLFYFNFRRLLCLQRSNGI